MTKKITRRGRRGSRQASARRRGFAIRRFCLSCIIGRIVEILLGRLNVPEEEARRFTLLSSRMRCTPDACIMNFSTPDIKFGMALYQEFYFWIAFVFLIIKQAK